MTTSHPFWIGVTVDHLYGDCPNLRRSVSSNSYKGVIPVGKQGVGTVDPEGTDICGLCHHRWLTDKGRNITGNNE